MRKNRSELIPDDNMAKEVQALTSIFNLQDVATEVAPGQGWRCRIDPENGIVISVDPNQLEQDDGSVDEDHVMFVARHELQHTRDMLDPDWKFQPDLSKSSGSDRLFWNYAHDIAIDGRTVKDYKRYKEVAPELYKATFKQLDISSEPKHIQFLKGLRAQSVLGQDQSPFNISSDVQTKIDELRQQNGHDIPRVMMHKGTSLKQRIALAEKFLKPVYEELLQQELQNGTPQDQLDQQVQDALKQGDMTQSSPEMSPSQPDEDQTPEDQEDEQDKQDKQPEPQDQQEDKSTDDQSIQDEPDEQQSGEEENPSNANTKEQDQQEENDHEAGQKDEESDEENKNSSTEDNTTSENEEQNNGQGSETFEEQLESVTAQYKVAQAKQAKSEQEKNEEPNKPDKDSGLQRMLGKIANAFDKDEDETPQSQDEATTESKDEFNEKQLRELAGTIERTLELSKGDAESYAYALLNNRPLIRQAAEIFTYLASLDSVKTRMTHNRKALPEGDRLNTGKLPQAYIQATTDTPMDVWRGRERSAPKIARTFSGLDVQILVDASASMNGAPAHNAAEMSLVLAEGLLLAREQQAKEVAGKQPDVKLSSAIFGSSTTTVMPLSYEPSPANRASLYTNTKRAGQPSTLVNPGLTAIVENARENSERDIVGIIISDNHFGDNPDNIIRNMPSNCEIFNLSLGGGNSLGSKPEYFASIRDTAELPRSLLSILKQYEKEYSGV